MLFVGVRMAGDAEVPHEDRFFPVREATGNPEPPALGVGVHGSLHHDGELYRLLSWRGLRRRVNFFDNNSAFRKIPPSLAVFDRGFRREAETVHPRNAESILMAGYWIVQNHLGGALPCWVVGRRIHNSLRSCATCKHSEECNERRNTDPK